MSLPSTNSADLAQWANVPLPLAELVISISEANQCDLKLLRSSGCDIKAWETRRAIAFAARRQGYSYSAIGRALNRDHSTIMYAVGAVRK